MDQTPMGATLGIASALLAQHVLDAARAGVVTFDAAGRALEWDRRAAEVLKLEDRELSGRRINECGLAVFRRDGRLVGELDDPVVRCTLHGSPSDEVELGIIDVDGARAWCGVSVVPWFGTDREPLGALAAVRDITRFVDAERAAQAGALRRSDAADVAVGRLVLAPTGDVRGWNQRVVTALGFHQTELGALRLADLCDVDLDWVRARLAANPELVRGRVILAHRNGDRLVAKASFGPVDRGGGERDLIMRFVVDCDPVFLDLELSRAGTKADRES